MGRRKRWLVALGFFLSFTVFIGGAYLIVALTGKASAQKRSFEVLLSQTDFDISQGYYAKAEGDLSKAFSSARGEYNLLRLLKRAHRIAVSTSSFSALAEFSSKALEKIPGSRIIRQLSVLAALRSGQSPRKIQLLQRSSSKDQDWEYLHAEAFLRKKIDQVRRKELSLSLQALLSLIDTTDPVQMQAVGTAQNDARIQLDAALLWMESGNLPNASALVRSQPENPLFQEPRTFISFDSGDLEDALTVLSSHPEAATRKDLVLLRADILRMLARNDEAAGIYQQLIGEDPAFSWHPYLNLAEIFNERGDKSTAYDLRRKAYASFPESEQVCLAYEKSLMEIGETKSAIEVLERLLKVQPQNTNARVLLLDMEKEMKSAAGYQAALWNLFNQHPENPLLCKSLFYNLASFEDLNGAAAVLAQFEAEGGEGHSPWFLELKGVLEALNGNYSVAADALRESIKGTESWRVRYNLALILDAGGHTETAARELVAAENALTGERPEKGTVSNKWQSLTRSKLAEIYLKKGDRNAARRESAYALELDHTNAHAHLILNLLEGK